MAEPAQSFPGAFCEPCNKWRKPDAVMPDGTCPRCRTELDLGTAEEPDAVDGTSTTGDERASAEARPVKVPWHFWVMVGATCIYLGWRIIQGVGALF